MESRFKTQISRMFRGSFGSCRTRNISDVVEKAVFVHRSNQKNLDVMIMEEPSYNKPQPPFLSICKPKCNETTTTTTQSIINPRQKISEKYTPFITVNTKNGHSGPPISPVSPFTNPFYKQKRKNTRSRKNRNATTHFRRRDSTLFSSSSHDSFYFEDRYFFTSEEEDEENDESDTLFSSRSLTSSSSCSRRYSHRRRLRSSRRKKCNKTSATNSSGGNGKMGVLGMLEGKVKDSFAVVKRSSDPYNDFMTSMVEMIVEKQIFGAKDLEQLLQCFLSLNAYHHHRTIIEVFTEIWETLFSSWF